MGARMHVHFLIHEPFEGPAAYETWAREREHEITYSRAYQREALPPPAADIDFLVVMGGPQSPATTQQECPYFDSAAEQALIARTIAAGKVVLGVCLGAQLVGEALGAPFEHSPETEIGKFPITLTPAGQSSERFAHFGGELAVGHWHNDMPGLTPDAVIIACSEGCPRQIVQYSDRVCGLQCHMEFNSAAIEQLIEASRSELAALASSRFVQQPDVLRTHSWDEVNMKLFTFLDQLTEAYITRSDAPH